MSLRSGDVPESAVRPKFAESVEQVVEDESSREAMILGAIMVLIVIGLWPWIRRIWR